LTVFITSNVDDIDLTEVDLNALLDAEPLAKVKSMNLQGAYGILTPFEKIL
jgi:hypothetical protein